MAHAVSELHASWARAWRGVGAAGGGETVRDALLKRYAEPHRRYHTTRHLSECLGAFDAARALPDRPDAVELALWFHDAVYDPRRSDNEAQSADWARSALLEAGAEPDMAARVHALVMATQHSAAPATRDEQVLVDIDLGILGAGAERFARYEQEIREEYGFVPEWLFKRTRRAILQSFVDRPRIFSTDHFHTRLEQRARDNLARSIAQQRRWFS